MDRSFNQPPACRRSMEMRKVWAENYAPHSPHASKFAEYSHFIFFRPSLRKQKTAAYGKTMPGVHAPTGAMPHEPAATNGRPDDTIAAESPPAGFRESFRPDIQASPPAMEHGFQKNRPPAIARAQFRACFRGATAIPPHPIQSTVRARHAEAMPRIFPEPFLHSSIAIRAHETPGQKQAPTHHRHDARSRCPAGRSRPGPFPQGTKCVPLAPRMASSSKCGCVMMTSFPPAFKKSMAAAILGPMLPAGNSPSSI